MKQAGFCSQLGELAVRSYEHHSNMGLSEYEALPPLSPSLGSKSRDSFKVQHLEKLSANGQGVAIPWHHSVVHSG